MSTSDAPAALDTLDSAKCPGSSSVPTRTRSLSPTRRRPGERNLIGSNTGNLVFSQAAFRLLSTPETEL